MFKELCLEALLGLLMKFWGSEVHQSKCQILAAQREHARGKQGELLFNLSLSSVVRAHAETNLRRGLGGEL